MAGYIYKEITGTDPKNFYTVSDVDNHYKEVTKKKKLSIRGGSITLCSNRGSVFPLKADDPTKKMDKALGK